MVMVLEFFSPLNDVTPFTYRDGETYLERLMRLNYWINELKIELQANIEKALLEFDHGTAVIKADADSAKESAEEAMEQATAAAASAAIAAAPGDAAVALFFNTVNSLTRAAARNLYAPRSSQVVHLLDYMGGGVSAATAFTNAWNAAANKTLDLDGQSLVFNSTLELAGDVRAVNATGATLTFTDDATANGVILRLNTVDNLKWTGGTIVQDAAARTGVYGMMTLMNCTNVHVDGLSVDGGSSTGLFVFGGNRITLRNIVVKNTKADGIHVTRGAHKIKIISPIVENTGDDAIGIISVTTETDNASLTYPVIKEVSIIDPTITNIAPYGGGVSLIGVTDCSLSGGVITNTTDGAIKIGSDNVAGAPQRANRVTVTGTLINNCRNGLQIGTADNCTITGVEAIGCTDAAGLFIVGGKNIHTVGGKFTNNVGFGVFEDSPGGMNSIVGADLRNNALGAVQSNGGILRISCIFNEDNLPEISAVTAENYLEVINQIRWILINIAGVAVLGD